MNRHARLLFGLEAILVLMMAGTLRPVCADGCVFPYSHVRDIEMPGQKAIIVWDAEKRHEDLILSVGLVSSPRTDQKPPQTESGTPVPEEDAASAAWVVPVPSRPEERAASPEWFAHLSQLTKPEVKTEIVYVDEKVIPKGVVGLHGGGQNWSTV